MAVATRGLEANQEHGASAGPPEFGLVVGRLGPRGRARAHVDRGTLVFTGSSCARIPRQVQPYGRGLQQTLSKRIL